MHFLKLAKTNIECAKKLKFYLCLQNRRKGPFMQTILTHILSIICSKKHPRSIWVTHEKAFRKGQGEVGIIQKTFNFFSYKFV